MRISDLSSDVCSADLGLTLNVPIFSGGYTQSRVRQSIYQRDAANDALELQRRQVIQNTLNYYRPVLAGISRSEERRAGQECVSKRRSRWTPCHQKNTKQQLHKTPLKTKLRTTI